MVNIDIICFSHLRWNFVFQRPQHLLSRFARNCRVFYVEEPVFNAVDNHLKITIDDANSVCIIVPNLKPGLEEEEIMMVQQSLLDNMLTEMQIHKYLLWYYSPMALGFTDHLKP